MKDLLGELEQSVPAVFTKVLLDTSQPLLDRLVIYRKAPEDARALVYDRVKPLLEAEYARSRLAATGMPFVEALPEPPGMEDVRKAQAAAAERARQQAERDGTADAERK
jgi:hypothetical protein